MTTWPLLGNWPGCCWLLGVVEFVVVALSRVVVAVEVVSCEEEGLSVLLGSARKGHKTFINSC